MIPAALLLPLLLSAGPADGTAPRTADPLQTARVGALVERAHAFLVANQNPDGSFALERGQVAAYAPVAVTGLTALSLMAGGHLPDGSGRGRYGRDVERAIAWLIDHCTEEGELAGYFVQDGDNVSRMHGQGYALLALTQAVGMYGSTAADYQRLRDTIQRAVGLIERTQGLHGGWWYNPRAEAAHEGSITVCMVQALRAAKDAGFVVDPDTIRRAEDYLEKSQEPKTGRFRYALGSDRTSWALTAASLATLIATGDYGSAMLEDGFEALRRDDPYLGRGLHEDFQEYGAFYAAQTYWVHRDRRAFEEWWPRFVDACESEQAYDGSFLNDTHGTIYATAITSLTLQIPFGTLPLFQR